LTPRVAMELFCAQPEAVPQLIIYAGRALRYVSDRDRASSYI
jgi:hypothetical protein